MAEGLSGTNVFTIAPGCADEKETSIVTPSGTKRCNLNQFLEYIWTADEKLREPKEPPISVSILSDLDFENKHKSPKSIEQISVNGLKTRIEGFADTNGKNAAGQTVRRYLTNEVDSAKLVDGASGWYDAVSKVGNPIGELAAMRAQGSFPTDSNMQKQIAAQVDAIIKNSGDTAEVLHELRMKDFELYRLQALREHTTLPIKTKKGGNTLGIAQVWDELDLDATIQAMKDADPNLNDEDARTQFATEQQKWLDGEWSSEGDKGKAGAHLAAVQSVDSARKGVCCGAGAGVTSVFGVTS